MVMNMSMGKDTISVRNMITKTEGIKNNLHMQSRWLTRTCTHTYPQTLNGGLQLDDRVPDSFHKLTEINILITLPAITWYCTQCWCDEAYLL